MGYMERIYRKYRVIDYLQLKKKFREQLVNKNNQERKKLSSNLGGKIQSLIRMRNMIINLMNSEIQDLRVMRKVLAEIQDQKKIDDFLIVEVKNSRWRKKNKQI